MRHGAFATLFALAAAGTAPAAGMLIPEDKALPPLAMVHHRVDVKIDDQVAITEVQQTFRNHTDRQLEATYLFPVPKGASVNKFVMFVDGKEQAGELMEAGKARQIYTDIVRRTQDPGLLEYMGNNLFRLRVFPILPKVDQKVTLRFTSVAPQDAGIVEYMYPLKTDGKATRTLEEFSIKASIKSLHPIQSIYSPTHAVTVSRTGDREASIVFERNQATLDKDFQLFYSVGDQSIGITPLLYRPITSEDGYFLMLISPQLESSKKDAVPRDLVLVLDTSGSMDAVKMDQARKALKHCLSNLNPQDRFAVVSFATNVRKYRDALVNRDDEHITAAKKWVDELRPGGGTAIQAALDSALEMRGTEPGRTFNVVFFTDGQPTIGEQKPEVIVKKVGEQNTANTRIFTFGVGDDVNTALLDQISEKTRAISTYVRPAEDIETKVSSLYTKISHPVLSNVKLSVSENIQIHEVYPPQLPDLFHGQQLAVFGRYTGTGPAAVKLNGNVGMETRELAYDVTFATKTDDKRDFVEHLWARRKVGFLLDQIRINGEQKELIDELIMLSKKYGIATPYTSYLIVPDAPTPVASAPMPGRPLNGPGGNAFGGGFGGGGIGGGPPGALQPRGGNEPATKVRDFAVANQQTPGMGAAARGRWAEVDLDDQAKKLDARKGDEKAEGQAKAYREAKDAKENFDRTYERLQKGQLRQVQTGRDGVDLAVCSNNLRQQERLTQSATRNANGRNCLDFGGVWIDEKFDAKMTTVIVKAQSEAYFRILEKYEKMGDVYRMGNHIVWVCPSGVALVIDANDGVEKLDDMAIDALFVKK